MNRNQILIGIFCLANVGCASERLYVDVVDNMGLPVTNATVHLGFTSGHVVMGNGISRNYTATTDENGRAVVKFNGDNSDVYWSVEANGYYQSEIMHEVFKIDVVEIPPIFYNTVMLEHEKNGKMTLWRKNNPQPMYSHGLAHIREVKVPVTNGRYGYDLKVCDWLPPQGKGEAADFYYVRKFNEPTEDGCVGWLEFDVGCGAYFGDKTGSKAFPSTYSADTNQVFISKLPFMFQHPSESGLRLDWRDIAGENQYLVLRTRAKVDSDGNVLEANYSKIVGPFRFGYGVQASYTVFNHRVNDTNLESDCSRNMVERQNSCGYPP